MKELYRIFHYNNGFTIRVNNITEAVEIGEGIILLVSADGEKALIKPGWVATIFKEAVAPAPVQRDTDGNQTR